jgi:putative tryptophan/tyrosine transport system substrate-binding protein
MRNKNLRKGSQETRMQDIPADTETRRPSSRVLQEVIRQAPAEYVTVGGLTSSLHRHSFGIIMLSLGLLATTPVGSTVPGFIDPAITAEIGQFAAIQTAAPSLGAELTPVNVRDAPEIERAVAAFSRYPNGGLLVTGSPLIAAQRHLIITLAARHKLPAVYTNRFFVNDGGLICYGPDLVDQHRRAAGYVDRILKGEKAASARTRIC